jgi:DNA-binding transcriptional MerR regulator
MRTLRTSEAAAYLNVSPNTLRGWEQRFGYPRPRRSPGRHRMYAFAELVALREALADGLAVSSAISAAREAVAADEHTLTAALLAFDYVRADQAMERGLALQSFERAVLQLMVPALQDVDRRHGYASAPWAFAARWADEWLGRAERLAGPPDGGVCVLFADCSCSRLDLETIHARILELFCVRAGLTVLRLPVRAHRFLGRATAAYPPAMVVLTGTPASEHDAAAFTRSVRSGNGGVPCAEYHRHRSGGGQHEQLSASPLAARSQILERLDAHA